MKLSLAMIVKNEEAHLGHCLASVRGLVDEVVVVDTGSSDGTVAVARGAGATVSTFPWTGDFAAARNASLDRATGDWVLVLDADEAVDALDHARLREACRPDGPDAFRVLIRNYLPDGAYTMMETQARANPGGYAEGSDHSHCGDTRGVRLFRRLAWVRFRGRIHEKVDACFLERGLPMPDLDTVIHHYGQTLAPRVEAKKPMYLDLARRDAEERPGDPESLFNLVIQAATAGDWELAAGASERYRSAARALGQGPLPALVLTQATALQRLGRHEEALATFGELAAADPGSLPAARGRAVSLERLGHREEAERIFRACLEIQPDFSTTCLDLADLLVRSDRPGDARETLRAGLGHAPRDPALWGRLIRLGLEAGDPAQAVRDAWEALQNCPAGGGGAWHTLVGVYLLREGATSEGRQVLALGLEAFPGHTELARLMGNC